MDTLTRWEQEAIGAAWKAHQGLLRGESPALCWTAALLCERYARACAEQAIAEVSPAWARVWRVYHEAALTWVQWAGVRKLGQ